MLLRAALTLADPDNLMGKLRTALDALVALGTETSAVPSVLVKREDRDDEEDEDEATTGAVTVELGQTVLALRASAIAALDAAENNILTKQPRTSAPTAADILAAVSSSSSSSSSVGIGHVVGPSSSAFTSDTELPSGRNNLILPYMHHYPLIGLLSTHLLSFLYTLFLTIIQTLPISQIFRPH